MNKIASFIILILCAAASHAGGPLRYIRGDQVFRDEITAAAMTIGSASVTCNATGNIVIGGVEIGEGNITNVIAGTITDTAGNRFEQTFRFVWDEPINQTEIGYSFPFANRKLKWLQGTVAGFPFLYQTGTPARVGVRGWQAIRGDHVGAHGGVLLTLDYPLRSNPLDDEGNTIYMVCEIVCAFEDADIPYGGDGDYQWFGVVPDFKPPIVWAQAFGGFGP